MAGIQFVLTETKDMEQFARLVDTIMETHDALNEQLVHFLKKKAGEAGIHAMDFHPTILRMLHKHNTLGLQFNIADNGEIAISCHACGNLLEELAWHCSYCDSPVLDMVTMRLKRIERSGEPRRFVQSRRGEWSHGDWLAFKGRMEWQFGLVPEERLGGLLESEKSVYWAEEERNAWKMSLELNTSDSYQEYLRRFPFGYNADGARGRIADMEREPCPDELQQPA